MVQNGSDFARKVLYGPAAQLRRPANRYERYSALDSDSGAGLGSFQCATDTRRLPLPVCLPRGQGLPSTRVRGEAVL